jgi:hypothetical protein
MGAGSGETAINVFPIRAAMASAARFSAKISTEIDTLSTITEQEESHTKGDDCERPGGRRMQYVSLAADLVTTVIWNG